MTPHNSSKCFSTEFIFINWKIRTDNQIYPCSIVYKWLNTSIPLVLYFIDALMVVSFWDDFHFLDHNWKIHSTSSLSFVGTFQIWQTQKSCDVKLCEYDWWAITIIPCLTIVLIWRALCVTSHCHYLVIISIIPIFQDTCELHFLSYFKMGERNVWCNLM
jgi:hypothetical protein